MEGTIARRQLRWKIAAAFLLAAPIAVAAVALLGLNRESGRLEGEQRESDLRLAQQVGSVLERGSILANTLANLAQQGNPSSWPIQLRRLIFAGQLQSAIAAVGIWPQPRASSDKRNSRYWLMGSDGELQPRADYNDPSVIAYYEEAWYTPARLLPPGRCYWTPIYREPLGKLDVVSCSLALREGKRFTGVVTVSLKVEALDRALREAARSQSGYSMLVDREDRLIGAGGRAENQLGEPRPRNLAELALKLPAFNPVALTVHRLEQAFLARPDSVSPAQKQQIAALSEKTRNFSRQEAESVLALIRGLPEKPGGITALAQAIRIKRDAVLDEPSIARVLSLDDARWKLIRVTSADEASGGDLLSQTLPSMLAAVVLSLLLAYAGVHLMVLRPLARLRRELALARDMEAAPPCLADISNDEIGAIGGTFDEQVFEMRASAERLAALKSEMHAENERRRRIGMSSVRAQEAPRPAVAQASVQLQANAALWERRIRAGLEQERLHLTTQWIEPARSRSHEGEVYAISVALEDEEGFWTERAGFMDIARTQNLAAAVDGWMLTRLVESLARDPVLCGRLAFCVLELSANSVLDGGLLDVLARLLQQHETLPAGKLCFAIDGALMDETRVALPKFCTTLRAIGCRVAIDHDLSGDAAQRERLRAIAAGIHGIEARRYPDVAGDVLDQTLAEASIRAARVLDRRVLIRNLANHDEVGAWLRRGADYLQGPAIARTSPAVFSHPESRAADAGLIPLAQPS